MSLSANMFTANSLVSVSLLTLIQIHFSACDIHIYVSPHGSDQNTGLTDALPVKTIQHALDLASNRQYSNTTVILELMQGYHDLDRTAFIKREKTLVRSYKHQEVHVTGGRRIPSSYLKPVTDKSVLSRLPANARSHVRVVNLHDLNITNFGKMEPYGSNYRRNDPLEVFYNGKPLRLASWPNEDYLDVVDVPDGLNGLRFRYNSTRPQSWHAESDPWVYGFWYAGWTDGAVKATSVDAKSMTVTVAKSPPHGIRKGNLQGYFNGTSTREGGYFRFINILSELDQPGEYYMDRATGKLYMWVPNGNGNVKASDIVYISMVQDCFWITRSDIRLEDFTVEYCRKRGVIVTGPHRGVLKQLEVRNTGSFGIQIANDVRETEVTQCFIHDTCGGMAVSGGNRKTLESSGNIIENNEITRYDRVGIVGNDALQLWGDGHTARYNNIYDGKSGAISFNGNDIVMEHNLIHHVCLGGSNCNALRTGNDWTMRGNVIQYNIIHNVVKLYPGGTNKGIMLDGQASGTTIRYNAFVNNTEHVYIGGGRYNIVNNNVMYNATVSSIHVDNRGTYHSSDTRLYQKLHAMPYHNSTWSLRYPHLADIDQHNASLPEGNQIVKNLIYMHPGPNAAYIKGIASFLKANLSYYFNISQTGFSSGAIDHVNVPLHDLRLRCTAGRWANRVNFKQPPSPNSVGPLREPVGPTYLNRSRSHLVNMSYNLPACKTQPPAKIFPVSSYLPDGSPGNNLYPVGHSGCWLNVTRCRNHSASVGTYRDMYGERYRNAADNETMCFQQAQEQWQFCGSQKNEWVVAIFAPTGSATIGGQGCMIATYGCPKNDGPADGHRNLTSGRFQFVGHAIPGQEGCLIRAHDFWTYCGYSQNYPVTAIYLPTGAKRTSGAGCWISMEHCVAHRNIKGMFYDAEGATNYFTDDFEFACHHRAEHYWKYCGSKPQYPVTATYRPTTYSKTYP